MHGAFELTLNCTNHAATVFDAAASLSSQVMPLDTAIGSHSKKSHVFGLTQIRSTPPSFDTADELLPVPCPKEPVHHAIGFESADVSPKKYVRH